MYECDVVLHANRGEARIKTVGVIDAPDLREAISRIEGSMAREPAAFSAASVLRLRRRDKVVWLRAITRSPVSE